jgi:hypothetical protein
MDRRGQRVIVRVRNPEPEGEVGMRGPRRFGVTLVVAVGALLAPAAAIAAPPTFTPLLEYGSSGQSSLVGSATVTGGSDIYYFEVWMNQPSGMPTNIQFESNTGADGGCAGGIRNGRGYVQCAPISPNAATGATVTTRFSLPAAYPANGGAQVTMISHGGYPNTTTVNVAGPSGIAGPGGDPCADLQEKVQKAKEKVDEADTRREKRKAKKKLNKAKKKLKKCEEGN